MFAPVFGAIAHQFSDLRDPACKDGLYDMTEVSPQKSGAQNNKTHVQLHLFLPVFSAAKRDSKMLSTRLNISATS